MRQMPDNEIRGGARTFAASDSGAKPVSWSAVAGSSALHAAIILLILVIGLPGLNQAPPSERIIPVNLVRLGAKTAAPASSIVAALPQEKAKEIAPSKPAQAVPVPETPPPPMAQRHTAERSPPDVLASAKPQPKSKVPEPISASRSDRTFAAKLPPHKPSPADELSTRLEMMARLRQPAAPVPPTPRQQEGSGEANVTVTSANAARGFDATYGVKDFIRAQVERRWNLDRSELKSENWTVSIHILIDPNGRVLQAEIIDDPRFRADPAYDDFALSARNAVLLSSPFLIPPGEYDIAKDIVVDFDSRQVSQ
jgi:hypothetical protein